MSYHGRHWRAMGLVGSECLEANRFALPTLSADKDVDCAVVVTLDATKHLQRMILN